MLAVSRSIGDRMYKDSGISLLGREKKKQNSPLTLPPTTVCPTPEISEVELHQSDEFLLIASDGLWDVMTRFVVVVVGWRNMVTVHYSKPPLLPLLPAKTPLNLFNKSKKKGKNRRKYVICWSHKLSICKVVITLLSFLLVLIKKKKKKKREGGEGGGREGRK